MASPIPAYPYSYPIFTAQTVSSQWPLPFAEGKQALPGAIGSLAIPTTHPPHEQKAAPTPKQRLLFLSKAGALIGSALLLKRLPKSATAFNHSLISSDWKEWGRVMLAIGGFGQAQKAANWEPPVWLNAMLNVALVTPLITRFNIANIAQGLVIAPFVGAFAGFNHFITEKAEKPLQDKLHMPPLATRILFSALTTVAGIVSIPAIGSAIPPAAKSWTGKGPSAHSAGTATRTAIGSTCVNGCCASMICANDVGQMGSAMLDSYQSRNKQEGKPT